MSQNTTTLSFAGAANEVEAHYDGKLVVHTTIGAKDARSHVISAGAGSFNLNTLFKLDLRVIEGACTVAIKGGARKSLKRGGKLSVPPGSSFSLKSTAGVVLQGKPKPGPGLGDIKKIGPRIR